METVLLWMTAIGAVVTALATVGLVAVAWWTLGGAKSQLVLQTEQARREGRPYVAAEALPGLHGAGHWDLVVRNYGKTVAREVLLSCPELEVRDGNDHITAPLLAYLASPRTLVPGARERVVWRMEADARSSLAEAGAPVVTTVTVTYCDDLGESYSDTFDFDLDALGAASPIPTEGPSARGSGKELANIEHALRTINIHLGELRR